MKVIFILLLGVCKAKDYLDYLDDKNCVSALVDGSFEDCEVTINNLDIQGVCEINTCDDKVKVLLFVRNRTDEDRVIQQIMMRKACDDAPLEKYVCVKMNTTYVRCYNRKIPSNGDLTWPMVDSYQPDPLVDELMITKIAEVNVGGQITNCGYVDRRLVPVPPKSAYMLCNTATSFPLTCDAGFKIVLQESSLYCLDDICLNIGSRLVTVAGWAGHACQGRQSCNMQRPTLCGADRTGGHVNYKCMP